MTSGTCNFTWVVPDSSVDVNVTQPNSINANLTVVASDCVPIYSDATCAANLTTNILVDPPVSPSTATTVQVAVIAVIFILFTGIPLVTLIYVVLRRKAQADHSARPGHSSNEEETAGLTSQDQDQDHKVLNVDVQKQYTISFQRLSYSVKLNKESRKRLLKTSPEVRNTKGWDIKGILHGLTGSFEPKTLSAIMGPSGCGKSTLLDVLADRKHEGFIRGEVLVNGLPRDRQFKTYAAYVMQSDALFPFLTVREVLSYSAELRLPGSNWSRRDMLVQRVIDELDLTTVADNRIGDPSAASSGVRGISGGQARRVTVGLELITEPSLLFLDEPTTGLDAYSSLALVRTLRKLADSGRTLLCTIHQPRPDIFKLFDKLLLMKAGEIAYLGPVAGMETYFADINMRIPEDVNPADFVVDLTYSKEGSDERESQDTVDRLVNEYQRSALAESNLRHVTEINSVFSRTSATGTSSNSTSMIYTQSIFTQMYILLRRSYKNISRNRGYFVTILLQSLQFLFYGLLFFNLEGNLANDGFGYSFAETPAAKAASFPDTKSFRMLTFTRAFLFQTMNTVGLIETVVIASAFLEKRIFVREHAAGSYSSFAYHLQWIIRFSVDAIWKAILATLLSYFLPQFTSLNAERVLFFFATLAVTSTIGSSLAFMMVSLVPDAEGAANIHNTIIGFMGLYSGFFLPPFLIPVFFIWAYFLSFLKYGFEALELNQFENCNQDEVLLFLQVDPTLNKWTNLLVYMAYPIIFHSIALLGTFLRTRSRRYWTEACPCCFAEEEDEGTGEARSETKASGNNVDGDIELRGQMKSETGESVAQT